MPLSELKQPGPPQSSGPKLIVFFAFAIVGLLIGLVVQEFRLRAEVPPQNQMAQANKDFRAGDYKTAVTLFEQLASNNNALAEYLVGHMTELGLGVTRDPVKAVELYKKAAAQDVVSAELRLGEMYLHGDLVLPDFGQAKIYLEKAAYHGNPRAAMMLGQMYHDGIGMSADQTEAYAWSEVAILEGSAFAKNDRDASFHDLSEGNKNDAVAKASEILKIIKDKTAPVKVPTSK